MSNLIKSGTALLNRVGRLRLSRDLDPDAKYAAIEIDPVTLLVRLTPSRRRKDVVQVCYPRHGIAVVLLRPTMKRLGMSRFEAVGEYSARRVGAEIVVDLKHKTSASKKILFAAGGAAREAFDQCCGGTTKKKLQILCQKLDVQFPSVWRDMNDADGHGCRVERRGNWIRLHPPKSSKRIRRQQ